MPSPDPGTGLFPALLKHWRAKKGLSQLDLAILSEVSARHISFLETGRSRPSSEMVVRLATTLAVPLRHINAMLQAAGHPPAYAGADDPLPDVVNRALERIKAHQEPYPVFVVDRLYRVRDLNDGAAALFSTLLGLPRPLPPAAIVASGANLALATFDPEIAQPTIVNFDEVGRQLLWRIQREALAEPDDGALHKLLEQLLAMPTVPADWRDIDLSLPSEPALVLHLRRGSAEFRFLTLITAFQAPQNVGVEELRIESWFPEDVATEAACRGG